MAYGIFGKNKFPLETFETKKQALNAIHPYEILGQKVHVKETKKIAVRY
jgi:hypothetical protein